MFTNYSQIVHTEFTNSKYNIDRKKEREVKANENKNSRIRLQRTRKLPNG